MTLGSFTKIPWTRSGSGSKNTESSLKEALDTESATPGGSFDPLLALSYSSSAALTKNDDESTEVETPLLEESSESQSSSTAYDGDLEDEPTDEPTDELDDDPTEDSPEEDTEKDAESHENQSAAAQAATLAAVSDAESATGSAAASNAISLKSSSFVSNSAASAASSRDQEASSKASKNRTCESVSSMYGSHELEASASNLQASEQSAVETIVKPTLQTIEDATATSLRPPLFPGRSRSNSSSVLKKINLKPGIGSFLRSRSNPMKKEKSDRSVEVPLKAASYDGIGDQGDVIVKTGSEVASVASCFEDTVEITAVDSKVSAGTGHENTTIGGGEQMLAGDAEDKQIVPMPAAAPEDVATADVVTAIAKSVLCDDTAEKTGAVKSDACDNAIGVVEDASVDADADVPSKTMNSIYATLSSASSNQIQDPWPNPWSEAESVGKTPMPAGLARNPHIAASDEPADSVLKGVIDVVKSANPENLENTAPPASICDGEKGEKGEAPIEEEALAYEVLPNPAASDTDLVEASPNMATDSVSDLDADQSEDPSACISSDENTESPALLQNWKELLTTEKPGSEAPELRSISTRAKPEEAATVENKEKARRQSSLWSRTQSMVKSKRQSTTSEKQSSQASAKKSTNQAVKKSKGQKFKLGYLCLLNPCSKKLSTIKEVDEAREPANKSPEGTKAETVAVPSILSEEVDRVEEREVHDEASEEMEEAYDDLIDILGNTETLSGDAPQTQQPPSLPPQPVIESQVAYEVMSPPKLAASGAAPDLEEAKSDLIQLDIGESKQDGRSWLTDLPSVESMTGRQQPQNTFSDVSTIGDLGEQAAGPNMINSINFYVSAASKAVQHNLYDVPVREFEKIRDLTCGAPTANRHNSLLDKGLTATESHDSIKDQNNAKGFTMKKSTNPFAVVFSELVDVLECAPAAAQPAQPTTKAYTTHKKFEEAKIEMLGSR